MPTIEVKVPDIGDFKDVPVIEIFVQPGDTVKAEDSLITLESDKATMDVPSPAAGTVREIRVRLGDRIAEGVVVLTLETAEGGASVAAAAATASPAMPWAAMAPQPVAAGHAGGASAAAAPPPEPRATASSPAPGVDDATFAAAHASPSVRRFARELGVDLARLAGTGPKGRIRQEDVQAFVKGVLAGAAPTAAAGTGGGGALDLLPWPKVDFAKYGPIDVRPLARIRKISGANLARNWVMIPHVTQFDEADVTGLEAFRVALNKENAKAGVKVTMLAFLIAAAVAALRKFPEFNASLDGDNLVLKQYFNIGFAADTPNGLVVPVVNGARHPVPPTLFVRRGRRPGRARHPRPPRSADRATAHRARPRPLTTSFHCGFGTLKFRW